jgi:alkylated DNA repair dioxygenase AlkB
VPPRRPGAARSAANCNYSEPPPMPKSITVPLPPEGFRYEEDVITQSIEIDIVRRLETLPLKEFEFQGYLGKRRTISFGWHYNFGDSSLNRVEPIPTFLQAVRSGAASFAGLRPGDLPHVLVTEYSPGTAIGWHRDKAVFQDVVGVSLLSPCRFRLRRKTADGWERFTQTLEPRSIYLLRGDVRSQWEHSIPAVESLRYSITFRSMTRRIDQETSAK